MKIKKGEVYRFSKSGNLVLACETTNYGGRGNWSVSRVDSGKQMIVPAHALVDPNHPEWS